MARILADTEYRQDRACTPAFIRQLHRRRPNREQPPHRDRTSRCIAPQITPRNAGHLDSKAVRKGPLSLWERGGVRRDCGNCTNGEIDSASKALTLTLSQRERERMPTHFPNSLSVVPARCGWGRAQRGPSLPSLRGLAALDPGRPCLVDGKLGITETAWEIRFHLRPAAIRPKGKGRVRQRR